MSALGFGFHYGILPILDVGTTIAPASLLSLLRAVIRGGATWVQLRAKDASDRDRLAWAKLVREETGAAGVRFFINDRADLAMLADADGVHLGQADLPAREVRRWWTKAIGVSCHDRAQVEAAAREGIASYLGFGPVFATVSKQNPDPVVGVDGLFHVRTLAPSMPIIAIGGINSARLPAVRSAGAAGVAVISSLFSGGDPTEVEARFRTLKAIWIGADGAPTDPGHTRHG